MARWHATGSLATRRSQGGLGAGSGAQPARNARIVDSAFPVGADHRSPSAPGTPPGPQTGRPARRASRAEVTPPPVLRRARGRWSRRPLQVLRSKLLWLSAGPRQAPVAVARLAVTAFSVVRAILEVLLSLLFALSGGTQWSRRMRVVRKSGVAPTIPLRRWAVVRRGISRALSLPIQSTRFALRSAAVHAARGGASVGRGRICCASYDTPSRHIA